MPPIPIIKVARPLYGFILLLIDFIVACFSLFACLLVYVARPFAGFTIFSAGFIVARFKAVHMLCETSQSLFAFPYAQAPRRVRAHFACPEGTQFMQSVDTIFIISSSILLFTSRPFAGFSFFQPVSLSRTSLPIARAAKHHNLCSLFPTRKHHAGCAPISLALHLT